MDSRIVLGEVTPVVPARDVAAALTFYTEKLGFSEDWRTGEPPSGGGLRRGAMTMHLFRCDDPKIARWSGFRVRCEGIEPLYEHCRAQGIVHPEGPLGATPWGTREFVALDPDGVALTFWEPLDTSA